MISIAFLIFLNAAATEIPVFHASYDQNFSANSGNEIVDAKVSQELLWETFQNLLQPGIVSNAAVIGTSGRNKEKHYHAVYSNKGYLDNQIGTVSFWIKPMNWEGNDQDCHIFFQAVGPDSSMLIYKFQKSPILMFLLGPSKPVNGKYVWSSISTNIGKWKAGDWHHLAAAYNREKICLYVDGKKVGYRSRSALPEKPFLRFSVGALYPGQWKTPLGLSLIDELKIFKNFKSAEEIHMEYRSYKHGSFHREAAVDDVATIVDRQKNELKLFFTAEGEISVCRISMTDGEGKDCFIKQQKTTGAQQSIIIPLSGLVPGNYTIGIAGLNENGTMICHKQIAFLLPQIPEPWKGNRIGLEPGVPPPWTTLNFSADRNCISGTTFAYELTESPFPNQIIAKGIPLLNRPVTLKLNNAKCDGWSRPRIVKKSPEKIILQSEAKAGHLRIKVDFQCEFDGFSWVKLSIIPEQPVRINNLQLEFPFLLKQSSLFNSMNKFYHKYLPGHCGKFQNYNMNLYKRPPIMFVGNDFCGLQWFCEKLPDWRNRNPDCALQLISGSKENLLRLNMIDMPSEIQQPLVYEFGFQSVPIRPMPSGWRTWCPYGNFDPYFVWSKYHHYPYANALRTDEKYKQMRETKTRQFGNKLFYYTAGFTITPTFPEWPYYNSEWILTPPENGLYGCLNNPAAYFAWICPQSSEYRDFYLDRLQKLVDELNIPNIYIDNSDAQMCGNVRHGCGYTGSDGRRYNSFNLRATRQLAMRIYKMFREKRPDGKIIRHMSAKPVAPVVAFADMLADGELYNKTVADDESYFNIFDPEMFRASFCGSLWGIPQFFIPQFTRVIPMHNPKRYPAWKTPAAREKQMDKIRHFKGYFLVHDAQIFQLFGVKVNDIESIKQRFGITEKTRFIGYNDETSPCRSKNGVMVSAYVEQGKLMLIVMNEKPENTVSFTIDQERLRKLGIKSFRLRNAETGKTVQLNSDRITLPLNYHDYMILWNL
ncbi:MAG: LamG domain-containing protein [Lentisphaeria bacterium]|nr:LamG domain-containing protein [Lentisphaeria bacterium]